MKKILIYSNGEKLGDGIIKLPFINDLKNEIPNSEIFWLTHGNTVYKNILKPFINKKIDHVYDNARLNYFAFNKATKKYNLEDIQFDLIIDTQKTFLKTITLKKLKSIYFLSNCTSGILSNFKDYRKPKNEKTSYYLENIYHLLELYLGKKLLKKSKVEYPLHILKKISNLFDPNKKYFGVAPGAGEKNKIWETDKYIEIINKFKSRGYTPCYFLGPEDKIIKDKLIETFNEIFEPENFYNEISNIHCIMACTNFIDFAISNDSGVSHILSTGNCHLFKIFNDKIPSKFTLVHNKIHSISPPFSKKINDISVDYVYQNILKNLN